MSRRLRLHQFDTSERISLQTAMLEESAHRLHKVPLRRWRLPVDDVLQRRAVHHGNALVAMLFSKSLEIGSAVLLRAKSKRLERLALVVAHELGVDGARDDRPGRRRRAIQCIFVNCLERWRPRHNMLRNPQPDLLLAGAPNVPNFL